MARNAKKKTPRTTETPAATPETASVETLSLRDRVREMREIDISSIRGMKGNPKLHTERDADILDASLNDYGYVIPVAVRDVGDGTYELVDGHHRIDRIRERHRDVTRLKVIVLDVESVAEGRRILLALKHTAEWDMDALESFTRQVLADGASAKQIMDVTGLTAADVDALGEAGAAFLEGLDQPPPFDVDPAAGLAGPTTAGRAIRAEIFSDEQLEAAFFEQYRERGFPYTRLSRAECMVSINRLASMPLDGLVRTTEGYEVADLFQRHRFEATAEGMIPPLEAFNDDERLKHGIALAIKYNGTCTDGSMRSLIGLVKRAQACSNFRPGFASYMYRRFCPPGGRVLDTSTGYGGRLVGAISSCVVAEYVGIDPNPPTAEGNRRLLRFLGFDRFATLIQQPAEDVRLDAVGAASCDFAFTSPPYFRKEHYSDDDTQSWKRYPEPDAWREGFLVKMIRLTHDALKPGAHCAVNIGDVLVGGIRHPLGEWTVAAARRVGLEHVATLDFPMTRRFGSGDGGVFQRAGAKDEVATEPVFVFRRPQ
jgi:ParB-like nuclease domain